MPSHDPAKGVVVWAQEVARQEPHGLAEVENVLLYDHPENKERTRHGVKRGFGDRCGRILIYVAFAAPLYGPVGFTQGSHRGLEREFDPNEAYLLSALAFIMGAALLGYFYRHWRSDRLRNGLAVTSAATHLVAAALTLYFAYSKADLFQGSTALYMAPVWIVFVLALITLGYQIPSPRNPAMEWQRFDASMLATEDREMLLGERTEAIRVLADRGLLEEDESVEALTSRPLGELHIPMETTDEQHR